MTSGNEDVLSLDVSVDDLLAVDILKCHSNLNDPIADLLFSECLVFLLLSLNVICQVANYSIKSHD